jgi:hypothetical protein
MTTRDDEAQRLAEIHYEVEDGITQIFRITRPEVDENRPDEPIKLLEVSESTIATGIMSLRFGPAPDHGIHHASLIVEVTPEEFSLIEAGSLRLPEGWSLGELMPIPTNVAVS